MFANAASQPAMPAQAAKKARPEGNGGRVALVRTQRIVLTVCGMCKEKFPRERCSRDFPPQDPPQWKGFCDKCWLSRKLECRAILPGRPGASEATTPAVTPEPEEPTEPEETNSCTGGHAFGIFKPTERVLAQEMHRILWREYPRQPFLMHENDPPRSFSSAPRLYGRIVPVQPQQEEVPTPTGEARRLAIQQKLAALKAEQQDRIRKQLELVALRAEQADRIKQQRLEAGNAEAQIAGLQRQLEADERARSSPAPRPMLVDPLVRTVQILETEKTLARRVALHEPEKYGFWMENHPATAPRLPCLLWRVMR
jgi:hypothetical protein